MGDNITSWGDGATIQRLLEAHWGFLSSWIIESSIVSSQKFVFNADERVLKSYWNTKNKIVA